MIKLNFLLMTLLFSQHAVADFGLFKYELKNDKENRIFEYDDSGIGHLSLYSNEGKYLIHREILGGTVIERKYYESESLIFKLNGKQRFRCLFSDGELVIVETNESFCLNRLTKIK